MKKSLKLVTFFIFICLFCGAGFAQELVVNHVNIREGRTIVNGYNDDYWFIAKQHIPFMPDAVVTFVNIETDLTYLSSKQSIQQSNVLELKPVKLLQSQGSSFVGVFNNYLDNTTSVTPWIIYPSIAKFDSNMDPVWNIELQPINGVNGVITCSDFLVETNGDIIMVGKMSYYVNNTPSDPFKTFVAKYSSLGALLDIKYINPINVPVFYSYITKDVYGNYYIAETSDSYGTKDIFLSKLDSNLDLLFSEAIITNDSHDEVVSSIAYDELNNRIVLGGYSQLSGAVFNDIDALACQCDLNGNVIWYNEYCGLDDESINSLVIGYNNNESYYYFTGATQSTPAQINDLLYLELNSLGSVNISHIFGGENNERGHQIILDESEWPLMIGYNTSAYIPLNIKRPYVVKHNPSWVQSFIPYCEIELELLKVPKTFSKYAYENDMVQVEVEHSTETRFLFEELALTSTYPCQEHIEFKDASVIDSDLENSMQVIVNKSNITISDLSNLFSNVNFQVVSSFGQVVINGKSNGSKFNIDTSSLPSGIYIVNVYNKMSGESLSRKIIITK